jgi:hypothetical protein
VSEVQNRRRSEKFHASQITHSIAGNRGRNDYVDFSANPGPPAPNDGGVVIHDDAPVENEDCIMNDAAPVTPAIAI